MRSNLVLSGEVRTCRESQETSQGAGSLWAVVLAGGEGVRLRPFVRRAFGDERPKQFCPLFGPQTLLRQTLDRVGRLIPPDRVVVVGLESHERYLACEFGEPGGPHVLKQPESRGTAAAVWNTLVFVAEVGALLATGRACVPSLSERLARLSAFWGE